MTTPTTPTLFAKSQLAAIIGNDTLSDETYQAVHDWVLDEIRGVVGDALTDPPQPGVLSVALALARGRAVNPGNLASKTIGPLAVTYSRQAPDTDITHKQRIRLLRACGLPTTYSVQTAATTDDAGDAA